MDAKQQWLTERLVAQTKLAKHDPPAVTADDIRAQRDQLKRIAEPIVTKVCVN